jgi:hypothetical protein
MSWCYPLGIAQKVHLRKQVIAGELAGNIRKRIHKGTNPLKLLLDFGSSPGHQCFIIFQYITAL